MAIAVAAIRVGRSDGFCPITQSGRELSSQQLRYVLGLHGQPPLIAMDGDKPGRSSKLRIEAAATTFGRQVRVAQLPDGEDPASWLARKGPSGLAAFERASLWSPTLASTIADEIADDLIERIARIRLIQTVAAQYHADHGTEVSNGPGPDPTTMRSP
jgi:DNA primase